LVSEVVGFAVGDFVGLLVGEVDGDFVGFLVSEVVGFAVGDFVGLLVGEVDGDFVGFLVGVILGGDVELTDCADINGDGTVNVTDIVAAVGIILGDGRSADANSAEIIRTADAVTLKADGFIGAVQMTLSHDNDFSIELTNDAMVAEYKTIDNSTTLIIVNPQSEDLFTTEGDYEVAELIVANSAGVIDASMVTPVEFGLSSAYPNPFNPTTSVALSLPNDGYVSVTVYNLMGQTQCNRCCWIEWIWIS
jgi:hypothetical protein